MIYNYEAETVALWVLPSMLVLDLLITSYLKRRRKIAFEKLRKRGISYLKTMSWQDFERFCALHFTSEGYKVQMCGLGGADGGMYLLLKKGRKTTLVQCKHWKSKVSVTTVREMFGVMHAHKFDDVIIVALSGFTREAQQWIGNKPILLMSGEDMINAPRT